MSLIEYVKKRNFDKTPEPNCQDYKNFKEKIFVIQKHQAHHLHYDFRVEVGGILKSWAIPKGFENLSQARLAIETEDHPIDYAMFEGCIPKGEYGAGKVEIWDSGLFENITIINGNLIPTAEAIKNGHFNFRLSGKILKGIFTLQFFKMFQGKKQWLFIKNHKE